MENKKNIKQNAIKNEVENSIKSRDTIEEKQIIEEIPEETSEVEAEFAKTREILKLKTEPKVKKKRVKSKSFLSNPPKDSGFNVNLPNKLTIIRITAVPIVVLIMLFPYQQFSINIPIINIGFVNISVLNIIVFLTFVAVSATDFLDGYIARKYDLVTSFGKFLDPIADKLLVNSIFIVLVSQSVVPVVPVLLMISRDVIVDGVRMMAADKNKVIAAGFLGKVKTVLQMLTLGLVLLNNLPFELWSVPAADFMLWLSALVSVVSGINYFDQAKDIIFESK
ncbi:MAG: CDP-diacylglycerol--glycerol-3-phosphate 3-phosphatidyltransferase [Erysipelotrichaceae bacterium]